MSIGVAILGGGIFAREEHLPAVEASKDLTLKAVWSRKLKSAESLATDQSKVTLYSEDSGSGKSLDDLISRSDVHAVIVCLPILNQPEYIRKSLLAGKHVLSEKPVAENVNDAAELIKWYRSEQASGKLKATWGVAEQFRFLNAYTHGAEAVTKMGKVLNFRLRMQTLVDGGKYYETEWRKTPTHQGGFILDGGVHFTAGLRLLLGPTHALTSLSGHATQNQPHLPPVDTVDASASSKTGGTGTLSISFGTTYKGAEWSVACEKGYVSIKGDNVDVDGETTEVKTEEGGVAAEVRVWGESLAAGKEDKRQSPEEALGDLELIEAMLKSDGKPVELKYQTA